MKRPKLFGTVAALAIAAISVFFISADHLDGPGVSGTSSDIADFYAFQSPDPNNFVFVANLQGILSPGRTTEQAIFDENVLTEFNIDVDNDLLEDFVIQAIPSGDYMYFFGPAAPVQDQNRSQLLSSIARDSVLISSVTDVQIAEVNGKKFFAGPRDDPYFFDLNQFNEVINNEDSEGFDNPGTDRYAGLNVLSIVVEFPKSLLPSGTVGVNPFAPDRPIYNVWVETKRRR
ncbi:DUF4331 family protein [Aequorivita echinoideorum]|uniref:DUF4331 family protein n=1 Tax=Aequorivita echinoideorum TaxID=1549647 RepID=A0ABS5S5C1_9FLAO|nr:DUF4331 family protein [Aequorivita echinoideorum]MBT0608419.1 DUF4331 family protein [Aequorivita echinoideorum]